MTAAFVTLSFKNIAASVVGLVLALMCFFAAAPQARAADVAEAGSGITSAQAESVLGLLVAFGTDQATVDRVRGAMPASLALADAPAPAEFSATLSSGPAPLTVEFAAPAADSDYKYLVNFGSKGSGAAWSRTGLTHTYATPGTYTATLYRVPVASCSRISSCDLRTRERLAATTITVSGSPVAVSPDCPTPPPGTTATVSNGYGSCTVSAAAIAQPVAVVSPAASPPNTPGTANLVAAAAAAPWQAAVSILSDVLYNIGAY